MGEKDVGEKSEPINVETEVTGSKAGVGDNYEANITANSERGLVDKHLETSKHNGKSISGCPDQADEKNEMDKSLITKSHVNMEDVLNNEVKSMETVEESREKEDLNKQVESQSHEEQKLLKSTENTEIKETDENHIPSAA